MWYVSHELERLKERRKRDVYVLKKDLEQIDATESCSISAICIVSALLRRILRV